MSDTKQPAPAIMSAQGLVEAIRETEAYPPGGLVLNHEQALAAVEAYTAAIRKDEREIWAGKLQWEARFQEARSLEDKHQYAGLVLRNQARDILANAPVDREPR